MSQIATIFRSGLSEPLSHAEITERLREGLPSLEQDAAPRGRERIRTGDALRDDVRLLGALLGTILVERAGQETYRTVKSMRRAARQARERSRMPDWSELEQTVDGLLQGCSAEERLRRLGDTCGAFRLFLALAGIAEAVHQRAHGGSLDDLLKRFSSPEYEASVIDEALARLRIRLVATAHPTKILRQRILAHQREVYGLLKDLHRPGLSAREQQGVLLRLAEKIEVLWATQFSR